MSYVIRVTTSDGAVKDFDIRDADKAYSYYNSRQARIGADGVADITEWKIMEAKFEFDGKTFDTVDEAQQAVQDKRIELYNLLDSLKIESSIAESEYQPLEFPDKDWHANILRDTVIRDPKEIQQTLYEEHQKKLEANKAIDGDIAARSFSSASLKAK